MSIKQKIRIVYEPKNGIQWENYQIFDTVEKISDFIAREPEYFRILALVMREYRNPDLDPDISQNRRDDIIDAVNANLNLRNKTLQTVEFIDLLDQFYSGTHAIVSDLRGRMMEAIIYKFGPKSFSHSNDTEKCLEAIIYYNGSVIGGNNCDFDFIFHNRGATDYHDIDYFECKATLDGYINVQEPMSKLPTKKLQKWTYAQNVWEYFKSNTLFRPKIHFACFNVQTEELQNHLINNGFVGVDILDVNVLSGMINMRVGI